MFGSIFKAIFGGAKEEKSAKKFFEERIPPPTTEADDPQHHKWREDLASRNRDIITEVELICCGDNYCCPSCWPLDGMVWKNGDKTAPKIPRHKGCRCGYFRKARSWRDFGVDVPDMPPVERNFLIRGRLLPDDTITTKGPRGGDCSKKVIRADHLACTMEDWIRRLEPNFQRLFFASDLAYSLWSSKKIRGIDLLDPSTWKLRSDNELRRLFM